MRTICASLGSARVTPTPTRDRPKIVARQATLSVVPTERLLAGCPHHALDHPVRHPVPERLHTVLIDHVMVGLAVHLLLDGTRDGCQSVAMDVRRHGSIRLHSPSEHVTHVISAINGCAPYRASSAVSSWCGQSSSFGIFTGHGSQACGKPFWVRRPKRTMRRAARGFAGAPALAQPEGRSPSELLQARPQTA